MTIIDYVRSLYNSAKETKAHEKEKREEIERVQTWKKQVRAREYNKNELVYFVQYGYQRNFDNRYFMCGYLNAGGNKFKDISTGDVYDVFDAPYPDTKDNKPETDCSTIIVDGGAFIQTDGNIVIKRTSKRCGEFLVFDKTNIAPMGPQNICGVDLFPDKGSCSHVYELFNKTGNSGIISGENLLCAINEVNNLCGISVNDVTRKKLDEAQKRADERLKAERLERAKLTPEERDF